MQPELRITVLMDNNPAEGLLSEWGLSFYIEYRGKRYLFDTGSTDKFIANARSLGIDPGTVDCVVLSHAHYDHTGGTAALLRENEMASVYLSPAARENCWSRHGLKMKYIGLPQGLLRSGRIHRTEGIVEIDRGVRIVPHSFGMRDSGRATLKAGLYVRRGLRFLPDDFSHEQSLVFETERGLVVMNSCSHTGPEAAIVEAMTAVPDKKVIAYVGGLHLFRLKSGNVEVLADRLARTDMEKIYTGHCTGETAFAILKNKLGGRVELFHPGRVIEF